MSCLANRFDQRGYRMYSTLEQLLLKACRNEAYAEEMADISDRDSADMNILGLNMQLQTLSVIYASDKSVSVGSVVKFFQNLTKVQRTLYSEVITLVNVPAPSAISSDRTDVFDYAKPSLC